MCGNFFGILQSISREVRIVRTSEEVINLITKIRIDKAISLSELARKTGIAKSTLSRYENKTRTFPLNHVDRFATALGVHVSYLLGIHDEEILSLYERLDAVNRSRARAYLQKLVAEQEAE
ncbi:helix-turn-helix domain-containing protein [Levilactobacillus sp. HBUAS70063]|uniref:helix-turn-helix domain-containing protein n=1 Tax=Levilactobacillus sp. HBUAS70063 TaxID=3109359 RepID=UPI003132A9F2